MDLTSVRARFADEMRTTLNLQSKAVVEAFASVPREAFVGPGPWLISDGDGDPAPRARRRRGVPGRCPVLTAFDASVEPAPRRPLIRTRPAYDTERRRAMRRVWMADRFPLHAVSCAPRQVRNARKFPKRCDATRPPATPPRS
jgi:hypothetical protein